MHRAKSQRDLNAKFRVFLSPWSHEWYYLLPATMCDNICIILPTREAHSASSTHDFYWGPIIAHMVDLLSPTLPGASDQYL